MVGKWRRRRELERKPIKGVLFSSTLTTVGNWNSVLLGPSWEAEVQGSWVTDSSARRYTECFLQVRINLPALLPALMARRFPRLKTTGAGSWKSSCWCGNGKLLRSVLPLLCRWKMSAIYSTIFSVFSKYTSRQWCSLPLSSQLTYYYFNCIPFGAHTHKSISVFSVGVSPSHGSVNSWGQTSEFIYLLFLPHCPEQMKLQKLNLELHSTFRSGASDLGYSTSTFLAGSSALT